MSMTRDVVLLGVLTLLATPLAGQHNEYRCDYTHRESCGPGGCKEMPIEDTYLLVPELSVLQSAGWDLLATDVTIRRCASKGCPPVRVAARVSGAFLNLSSLRCNTVKFANLWTVRRLHGRAGAVD